MEVKILGTVSPYCKKEKNCPAYLVIDDKYKVLLDCGNGSIRNLNLPADLDNLNVIISHLHKDHYGDLLSLGYASYVFKNLGYLSNRLKVYLLEANTYDTIEYSQDIDGWGTSKKVQKKLSDYEFLTNFGEENFLEFIPYTESTALNIGNMHIIFQKNPHQINTYSTKISDDTGTFVYSADTGYQNNCLVNFAKKANLLLCESSFIRGQTKGDDNHLYAYEAAKIAKSANVDRLVLTHFFPEVDPSLYFKEAQAIFTNTEIAEEGKVYKIGGRK